MKNILGNFCKTYCQYAIFCNVFIFFWALFALTNNGSDNSEGLFHYQVAVQIIKHRQLGFDVMQTGIFQIAPNGRIYAGHEIGNTLFMLPTALINVMLEKIFSNFVSIEKIEMIQKFILSFQSGAYSALTATTFFAILHTRFSQARIPSFLATLCLVLTTYFWTYSRNLFDGVLCTTLLTLSFFLILSYRQRNNWWYLFGCFICLGFALITRISMILAILVSFAYLINNRATLTIKIREISWGLVTLLPFVAWQCWYNSLRTGFFYKSPVQTAIYAHNNSLDGNIFIGILGLIISPGKSLFIYAPLVILSILLFKKFYKEHQQEAIYVASLTILWFLLHARLRSWYGAWGWGPRHFITILPIVFLPFAVNFEYILKRIELRITAIFLGCFGFLLAFSSMISNWHFRMEYARQRGLLDDNIFVWGFWNSQAIDMLKGAFDNIMRIFTHAPIIKITDSYSEANEYASSTINIWSNSLIYTGIPWYVVAILVSFLLILVFKTFVNITYFKSYSKEK
ncbi:glycosyltransferase family 39 protein [Anabaena sp. CA = ATCC 33047]|uniref:glycosyltransferase family 39 protein n=1 Tax=Anabaena sp. (strain CA / ATCC 33047) TaxID=52271 RepID=UPI00082DD1DC|nr:glycosyltransferase family 39 protein [Anabaena sp. CA = ATCC 33047]